MHKENEVIIMLFHISGYLRTCSMPINDELMILVIIIIKCYVVMIIAMAYLLLVFSIRQQCKLFSNKR